MTGRTGRRQGRDRGAVTAELAAATPVLVLLLVVGLSGVSAVGAKLRCTAAARDAALAQARGEDGAAAARLAAPDGARISIGGGGDTVRADVSVPVHLFGVRLPALTVSSYAVAAIEPGEP